MTEPTRKTTERLGRKLRDYCWGLYAGAIRYVAIDGTDHRAEVTLYPPAMAVTHNGDRIDDVMRTRSSGSSPRREQQARRHPEHCKRKPERRTASLDLENASVRGPRKSEIGMISISTLPSPNTSRTRPTPGLRDGHALIQALDSRTTSCTRSTKRTTGNSTPQANRHGVDSGGRYRDR